MNSNNFMPLIHWLESVWYGRRPLAKALLWPWSVLFCLAVWVRRVYLQARQQVFKVPVVVIGNISVGGTGKTPLTLYLTELLQQAGYRVGIVSRGYGARSDKPMVRVVTYHSHPEDVGDEALLLAMRTQVPVFIGRNRPAAIRALLAAKHCDVVLSDDGLQHYRMGRVMEIVVIDGERRCGNGACLPAGPLREKPSRLQACDFRVVNGKATKADEYSMLVSGDTLQALLQPAEQLPLTTLRGKTVHAVTAIGNPQRFFAMLEQAGIQYQPHVFPDHHLFQGDDIGFADHWPVIMTEKDAVKCRFLLDENTAVAYWYLPVRAELDQDFAAAFLQRIEKVSQDGQKTTRHTGVSSD